MGDNVNFAVGQADLRMDSNGKGKALHHAFASVALIHNFDFKTLSNSEPGKEWMFRILFQMQRTTTD